MPQGRTAWERLTGQNKPVAVEKQYTNPLAVTIGATVRVDTPDHFRHLFTVEYMRAWTRTVAGKKVTDMTDYGLVSGTTRVVLRVLPRTNANAKNRFTHHFLAMQPYFEAGWTDETPDILRALSDPSGEFYRYRGEPEEEHYWRVNGVTTPYACSTALLRDVDGNGTVEPGEVEKEDLTLWDFWRGTTDEAGQEVTQFLYAQFGGLYNPATNEVSGSGDRTVVMYQGLDVNADKITAYDR
jgi:hypothetical protein